MEERANFYWSQAWQIIILTLYIYFCWIIFGQASMQTGLNRIPIIYDTCYNFYIHEYTCQVHYQDWWYHTKIHIWYSWPRETGICVYCNITDLHVKSIPSPIPGWIYTEILEHYSHLKESIGINSENCQEEAAQRQFVKRKWWNYSWHW